MPTSFRDRAYSAPPALSSLGMTYAWNPNYVNTSGNAGCPVTGAWIPVNTDTGGNLLVSIGNANFTGSLEVNTDALEAAVVSGNAYLAAISGELINGQLSLTGNLTTTITGISPTVSLNVNQTGIAGVSGNVNVLNTTFNVATTGLSFTGFITGYGAQSMEHNGGIAVVLSGFAPGYQSGQNAIAAFDNIGGGLIVAQADLNPQFDGVSIYYPQVSTVSNTTPSGSSLFAGTTMVTGQCLAANTGRQMLYIANISSTAPLYVRLGVGLASTGAFNVILNPSTITGYVGGIYTDERWKGAVQISGNSFQAWEY